jgi:putative ABC transport system permease protein
MRLRNDIKENLLLALGMIWSHKVRSGLTLLGVIVGTMTVITVSSILTGMSARVDEISERFGPNVAIVAKYDQIGIRFGRLSREERMRKNLTVGDAEAIAELSSVVGASPEVLRGSWGPSTNQPTVKFQGTEYSQPLIFGVYANYTTLRDVEMKQGRFFSETENERRISVVVIPEAAVEALFGGLNPLERELEVDGSVFRVIGVRARGVGGLFGGDGADDRFFYIPFGTMEKMHPELEDITITLRAREGQMSLMFDQVTETLRRRRGVRANAKNDFSISTPDAIFETIGQITSVVALIIVPISGAGLLVGGVGVMNIMLVSVTERTKEIGVRRAVGARRADIVWQFLIEAMSLTALGGVMGIFVGWFISTMVHVIFPSIPSSVPLWAVLVGFGVSVGVGLVFGLWPAIKAARLDPIDALRYE